jgi:transposase-like protein
MHAVLREPSLAAAAPPPWAPPPEPAAPSARRRYRRFDAAYKLRILESADRCTQPGRLSALLALEGLTRTHLLQWRRQRRAGVLLALTPRKREREPTRSPQQRALAQLERENARLRLRLTEAEQRLAFQRQLWRDLRRTES